MNQRSISWGELDELQMFAADKFGYIDDHEKWLEEVSDFVQTYIDGGKFVVYNSRNQFLADFDVLDELYTTKKKMSLKTNYLVLNVKFYNYDYEF